MDDGGSQPSSSRKREPDPRIDRALPSMREFFQIIPITMKRAISARKAALMVATVWNTSVPDNGFMSYLASYEARRLNHSERKLFRFHAQPAGGCARCQPKAATLGGSRRANLGRRYAPVADRRRKNAARTIRIAHPSASTVRLAERTRHMNLRRTAV